MLQPDQAFEIEMVARLVEQHHVGRIRRMRASATRIFQPPDSAPTSPSIISWRKLRPGQHLARAAFERVAVELLEAVLHLAVARDDRVHLGGARGIRHRGLESLAARPRPRSPGRRRPSPRRRRCGPPSRRRPG
jgi:hypothetical protein